MLPSYYTVQQINRGDTVVSITAHLLRIIFSLFLLVLLCSPVSGSQSPLLDKLKNEQVSLHSENQRIDMILRAIARQAGVTIYIDEAITDTITIEMEDRNLYDIFMLIMEAKHLRYVEKNGMLFIKREADYQADQQNLKVKRLCTRFGNADRYQAQLNSLLSELGTITVTDRGGCILVKDNQENIDSIESMLVELDRPTPQVHIKAKIVTINQDAKKRLGIRWGLTDQYTRGDGTTLSSDIALDQSVTANNSLLIGVVRNQMNLEFQLQALQEEGMLSVLSSPHILVLDGKEAEIKQGKEIAYVTSTTDTINTSFKEANLSLKVTPKILKGDYLVLELSVTNDTVSEQSTGGQPAIDTQEITSTLFLKNKETIVIGGIILENKANNKQQVPVLGDIPILGHLFRNKDTSESRSELNVFITPTIIDIEKRFIQANKDSEESENTQEPVTQPVDNN
jgi:type IV pilus assembly protein PilQ